MNRLMIIPAAGLGSRLQSATPKLLFPVNGRPMIDYLFDLYSPVVERFILVLHPSSEDAVRRHCAGFDLRIEYELQPSPTGMLDAILIPHERMRCLEPSQVWITWCDQIAVSPETVAKLRETADREGEAAVIAPTVVRNDPYIHFARNDRGEIVEILHRREGDHLPELGESDMGLFCLSWRAYMELLPDFAREAPRSNVTRERNFLPFISWLAGRAAVRSFPVHNEIESVGVNTADDLSRIERYLRNEGK